MRENSTDMPSALPIQPMSVEDRSGQGWLRNGSESVVASRDGLAACESWAKDGPLSVCKLRLAR
jgi:hypothetical protein